MKNLNKVLIHLVWVSAAAMAQSLPVLVPYEKPATTNLLAMSVTLNERQCSSAQSAIVGTKQTGPGMNNKTFTSNPLVTTFTSASATWTISPFNTCINMTVKQITDSAVAQASNYSSSILTIPYGLQGGAAVFYLKAKTIVSQLPKTLKNPQGKTVSFVGCADDRDNSKVVICCYSPNGTTTSCNF